MNEKEPQSNQPKRDWSSVDKMFDEWKEKETKKTQDVKPSSKTELEELAKKKDSDEQLPETDELVSKVLQNAKREKEIIESRKKFIEQEKTRLQKIIKDRPLTEEEKEAFKKLL